MQGERLSPYLASAALLMLMTAPVSAQQGAIAGRITDATTLAPISQATVSVVGGRSDADDAEVISEDDGSFELRLGEGTYDLLVEAGDFAPARFDRIRVFPGQVTTRNLPLQSQGYRLAGFIVTASRGVTASRRALDTEITAPSSSHSVSGVEIEERPATSPVEHLRETPGVDIATHGLQSSNVVVRGFNNIFSGSLNLLTDNRLAGLPALRVNLMHFLPLNDDDIDRMEVVLGPGAALYGPNTANGVVHVITKSPLESQGTRVTLGAGERSVFEGTFRSAFLVTEDFGVKLSGQVLRGNEWPYVDEEEKEARDAAATDFPGCVLDRTNRGFSAEVAQIACGRVGRRDYDILRYGVEARADWRYSPRGSLVATYGRMDDSSVELTGLGAVQADHWIYEFAQARLTYDRWFVQAYVNVNDAGDSFMLRDGPPLVDHSTLAVAQVQNSFDLADGRFDFTYGWDFFATQPESEGSIYGDYEDDEAIKEWGVYLQSKAAITPKIDVIAAGRIDSHSILPTKIFSPRLALVVKPNESNAIRFAYNRAFSTPTALNYFLDFSAGYSAGYGLRAFGTGRDGIGWWNSDGTLRGMRSPLTPPAFGQPPDSLLTSVDQATLWQLGVAQVNTLPDVPDDIIAILRGLTPDDSDFGMQYIDPRDSMRYPLGSVSSFLQDVPPIKESNTETFEVGWSGVWASRLRLSADVYYMRQHDFVSPLTVANPLLSLDGGQVGTWLSQAYVPARVQDLVDRLGLSVAAATAQANAEATNIVVPAVGGVLDLSPLAVVSSDIPQMGNGGADVIATYRNVGTLSLWGADFALRWSPSPAWTMSGTYSHVSKSEFDIGVVTPVSLNAPVDKATLGIAYRNEALGLNASSRVRYTGPFHVDATLFRGDIDEYALVDLTLGYKLPTTAATLQVGVSNVLNTPYTSFAGVPTTGRLAMVRLRYELF
ncbi:MAG: TonB-dependent receptor [Gemmatimonadota bacterium]